MKNIVFALILFSFVTLPSKTYAQSIEATFANLDDCMSIEFAARKLIPNFYEKKQIDSIELILDFLKIKCEETNAHRLVRYLIAIEQRKFEINKINTSDLIFFESERHAFKDFSYRMRKTNANFQFAGAERSVFVNSTFIEMLSKWSSQLIQKNELSSFEFSLLIQYIQLSRKRDSNGLRLFKEVKKDISKNTSLRKKYKEYHDNFRINHSMVFGFNSGFFTTFGDGAAFYGNSVGYNFLMGGHFSPKDRIDLSFNFRGSSLLQPINIVRPDTAFQSLTYRDVFAYIDYVRAIYKPGTKFSLNSKFGIGAHTKYFFDELDEDSEVDNEPNDVLNSRMAPSKKERFSFSLALEANYFFAPTVAISVSPRYFFTSDFSNYVSNKIGGNQFFVGIGLIFFIQDPESRNSKFRNLNR